MEVNLIVIETDRWLPGMGMRVGWAEVWEVRGGKEGGITKGHEET